MNFHKFAASLLIIFSGSSLASDLPFVPPQTYALETSSYYEDTAGIHELTGSFSIGLPLGLPPIGNVAFLIMDNVALSTESQSLDFTGYNYDFFPVPIGQITLSLDSSLSIQSIYSIYLGVTQTDSGSNFYEYREVYLEPIFVTDTSYNLLNFTNPSDFFPDSMLLTYELHSVSSRLEHLSYPPEVIGPAWVYSVQTDEKLGTLSIYAVTAPIPEINSSWHMGFGLIALVGFRIWRRAKEQSDPRCFS